MVLLSSLGFVFIAILVIAAVTLLFEIVMIISAFKNKHISPEIKALWILGMLLIHPFVAIIYYFTDYQKTGRKR